VASAADIMFLLLFLQVNLALIMLRKKRPDLDRGFAVPLFPVLSVAAILMLLFLAVYMFQYSLIAWVVTGVWIGIGLIVYRGYAADREIIHVQKVRALERIEQKDYRILVCLSSPRTASSLTAVAFAVAKTHNAELIFLNIIEVRGKEKLQAGLDETTYVRPEMEEVKQMAAHAGIPSRFMIRVSHRISQGIIDTAIEEDCNFIVMGRQKNPDFFDRVFSSLIDSVIQKAPTETAILHGACSIKELKTILIPFGANIHTRLAMEIAPALADYFGARLRVAVVLERGMNKAQRDERMLQVNEMMNEYKLSADLVVVKERDVLQGITNLSKGADLLLMGGRSGDFMELLFAKSLTMEITRQAQCPVLWIKEYEESMSFWSALKKMSVEKKGERRHE